MTPRHLILAVGLGVSAWLAYMAPSDADEAVVEPAARNAPLASPAAATVEVEIAALVPREQLVGAVLEGGASSELFSAQSWTPPPPPPPPQEAAAPPPPPSAPPLPFKYLGRKSDGERWEVYVSRGDQTYVIKEKGVIDGVYRVDAVTAETATFTYLPMSQTQVLQFGEHP